MTGPGRAVAGGPAEPVWFGPVARPLFGWVHQPAGGSRQAGAVVLCSPLFREQAAAHYPYRVLARELSAAGFWALRFDYEGTGDSAGPSVGPGSAAAWLAGIVAAVGVAGDRCPGPVALVGMRMGALLAAEAAARCPEVDRLVLWDPCTSGRSFLRRYEALQRLRFGDGRDDGRGDGWGEGWGDGPPGGPVDGCGRGPMDASGRGLVDGSGQGPVDGSGQGPVESPVELPGAVLDRRAAADVGRMVLPVKLPVDRALVLCRPGSRPAGYRAAVGASVEELHQGEQEALLEVEPLHAKVPWRGIDRVTRWLAGTTGPAVVRSAVAGSAVAGSAVAGSAVAGSVVAGSVRGGPERDGGSRHEVRPAASAVAVDAGPEHAGMTVRERAVRLGPSGLFAIETLPGEPAEAGVVVLFLSSGNDPHPGPSRLWVTLARRWAAEGVRCVRVDLSGLGDSPARPGRAEQVLRAAEAFDDVAEAVDAVAADRRQVVLVGLCSGAYQALESALDLAPRAVLAVNPLLRFTPPETAGGGSMSARRRLCQFRAPWVASLRTHLPRPLVDAAVAVRTRWAGRQPRTDWHQELAELSVAVLCICGPDEARQVLADGRPRGAAGEPDGDLPAAGGLRVEVVEGLDHALLSVAQRDWVADRLTEELGHLCGPAPAATGTTERGAACEAS